MALMARAALVPQARAPSATQMARVGQLVLVTRVGLVLRARASSIPSATLVALAGQLVLVVLVLGVVCERWWLW